MTDDNETWIIEAGARIMAKMALRGASSLSPWEQLVRCLWVLDYAMTNAGDLEVTRDLFPEFAAAARRASEALSLNVAQSVFAMPQPVLEASYFQVRDALCNEIRSAAPPWIGERL
jgi:hypothetical protein